MIGSDMALTEKKSWKAGPDDMYTVSYDPENPDEVEVDWEEKCHMTVTVDDDPEDLVLDETDLRWMECYRPWLVATVHGKTVENMFFEEESEAKTALKEKYGSTDESVRSKTAFYLVKIDGSYYYEDGKGVLIDKVDPETI